MAELAFLGTGHMGAPMAARLLAAGHRVRVWNRTPEKLRPLVEAGGESASSPAEAAAGTDGVITMLSGPEAVEAVIFGPGGASAGLAAGQLLVEMSTVGPETIRSLHDRVPEGVTVIDAPVRGTVPQATDGTLTILVGTTDEAFRRVERLLAAMGTPVRVGGPGAGAAMKLVVNSTLLAAIVALGEALALSEALGLEGRRALDILADSPIGAIVRRKRDKVERRDYSPTFKLGLALKDAGLVEAAAASVNLELKLADAVRACFEEAVASGAGELDFSAVVSSILGWPLDTGEG